MRIPSLLLALMLTPFSAAADSVKDIVLTEENKVFNPVMGPVSFADAFGDRGTGPHGTFGQFPGKFETPVHTHSHSYRAVVLKGQMTNPFVGDDNVPVMEAGSYWSVAANTPHTTACVSVEPCEFFMFGDEGFDFVPTE